MKFKTFINEKRFDLPTKCEIIKSRCSQFLEEAENYPLYHGQHSEKFENETFNFRRIKDSFPWASSIFNLYIEEKFNIKKIRNEHSVFTSGHYKLAEAYGKPFLFFPENGYKYVWSSIITDFYPQELTFWKMLIKNIKYEFGENEGEEIDKILRTNLKDYQKYSTIDDIILTHSNDFKTESGKNAYSLIRKILVETFDVFYYNTKKLKNAITSENEIIFKTEKYFLIDLDEIEEHFKLETTSLYDYYTIRYEKLLGLLR